jgi:tetratricopeptide (TPR) repeat protein
MILQSPFDSAALMNSYRLSCQAANAACLGQLSHRERALEYCESAGQALSDSKFKEAIALLKQALAADPTCAEAFEGIGCLFTMQLLGDKAQIYLRRALSLEPERPSAWAQLSHACLITGRFDEALACGKRSVEIDPQSSMGHSAYGNALFSNGEFDRGLEHHGKALELNPDDINSKMMTSFAQLMRGDYEKGWASYQNRLLLPHYTPPMPPWNGEPLNGAGILIVGEQGLGDILQFVRFVPQVAERGGKVRLEVPIELLPLLKDFPGTEKVSSTRDYEPSLAYHCHLMSLPFLFGTTLEMIPCKTPYLTPPSSGMPEIAIPERKAGALKVGLVWSGNKRLMMNSVRSIAPNKLSPLANVEGVTFYSLQYRVTEAEVRSLFPNFDIVRLPVKLADLSLIAAVMAMDIVITVDTSVAHLAGALGKPVWILLSYVPDWRWLRDTNVSPWYSTARLFRQRAPGGWDEPVEELRRELQKEVERRKQKS